MCLQAWLHVPTDDFRLTTPFCIFLHKIDACRMQRLPQQCTLRPGTKITRHFRCAADSKLVRVDNMEHRIGERKTRSCLPWDDVKAAGMGASVPIIAGILLKLAVPPLQRTGGSAPFIRPLIPHLQHWAASLRSSPTLVLATAAVGWACWHFWLAKVHTRRQATGGAAPPAHWRLLSAAAVGAAVPALLGVTLLHVRRLGRSFAVFKVRHYNQIIMTAHMPCSRVGTWLERAARFMSRVSALR